MTRRVLYVAHPLAPTPEEIADIRSLHGQPVFGTASPLRVSQAVDVNLQRALRWLAWLRASFPETTFIAPWIATVQSLNGDDSPELREAGLVDDCAVVERCDGIVLCGGRISSGMRREMEHFIRRRRAELVYDLTTLPLASEPPHPSLNPPGGCSFREWVRDLVVTR